MLRILKIMTIILLLPVFLWLFGLCLFTLSITFSKPSLHVQTDAIIVLTGGPGRVNAGFDLLESGRAKELFISGVGEGVTLADLTSLWKKDVGEPPCCVTLGRKAQNTQENAAEVQEWARKNDVKSILLVTAHYHMPRAAVEFSRALPQADIIPYPLRPAKGENRNSRYWKLVFEEYNKMLLTFLHPKLASALRKIVS